MREYGILPRGWTSAGSAGDCREDRRLGEYARRLRVRRSDFAQPTVFDVPHFLVNRGLGVRARICYAYVHANECVVGIGILATMRHMAISTACYI